MKKIYLSSLFLGFFFLGCSTSFAPQKDTAQKEFESKNYAKAIDAGNDALLAWKLKDGLADKVLVFNILGQSYQALGNLEKAAAAYEDAIKIGTAAFQPAYNLGYLNVTSNKPLDAIPAFKKALDFKPNDPLALIGLGHSYFSAGNYTEARNAYDRLLDTSPGVRDALSYLSIVNKKLATPHKKPAAVQKTKKKPAGKKSSKKLSLTSHHPK